MNGPMALTLVLVALVAVVTVEAAIIRDAGCKVSINYKTGDLKEPQPLILLHDESGADFLHPADQSCTLKLARNEKLLIACPGRGNYIEGIPDLQNVSEVEASCVGDRIFSAETKRFNFTSVSCKSLPKHEARREKTRCSGNATKVEIGFKLQRTFVRTIDICWDAKTMMARWSRFSLTSSIGCFQSGYPRTSWQSKGFYEDFNIDLQYKTKTELRTVTQLLGSKDLASKYINPKSNSLMARGHMTAKADFVYGAAQSSSFWYLNIAPQWQSFNAGNWNSLENNVRQFAAKRNSDIEVYTGVHGQMSLDDVNGNRVPMYLYANGTRRAFPVPRFYWKVIYDRGTRKGTAFVGLNDPWAQKITDDMFLCDDISDRIKWLTWNPRQLLKGISYACEVDDLREAVPTVPNLEVDGILA